MQYGLCENGELQFYAVVPEEIEDNAYAKFWGTNKCIRGDV